MKKVLVVYAHPQYNNSRMNKALIEQISDKDNITISNLYQKYPDGKLDISLEQELISSHDLLVLQFPFYWFSTTPLMKQWIDEVFTAGFAYGPGGTALHGKDLLIAITLGGSKERYANETNFTLPELLKPFAYTAIYCNMIYQPPFIVADPDGKDDVLQRQAYEYFQLLEEYTKNSSFAFNKNYPSFK